MIEEKWTQHSMEYLSVGLMSANLALEQNSSTTILSRFSHQQLTQSLWILPALSSTRASYPLTSSSHLANQVDTCFVSFRRRDRAVQRCSTELVRIPVTRPLRIRHSIIDGFLRLIPWSLRIKKENRASPNSGSGSLWIKGIIFS